MIIPNLDIVVVDGIMYVIEFVRTNPMTIAGALVGLKWVAKKTPWAADDKIYTMLSVLVGKLTFKSVNK